MANFMDIAAKKGFTVNGLRTNATLLKDEWIETDNILVEVARQKLTAVTDLTSRGFVKPIDGMSHSVLEWQRVSKTEGSQKSMSPKVRGDSDRPDYDLVGVPLPIEHADFDFGEREIRTSRNKGLGLDFTMLRSKTEDVLESIEDTLVNGASGYSYGGYTIRGYTDFPSRNTYTMPLSWTNGSITGDLILADVLAMKQENIDAKKLGPYILYIPSTYSTALDGQFKANSDRSIREVLLDIEGLTDIKTLDKLATDNVLLNQLTSDVAKIVDGMPLTTVQWKTNGEFCNHFKVLTIMVPQLFADQEGNCGITHGSVV